MVSLNDLKKFAKEKKLVSDGLELLNNPLANTASSVAEKLGYGKTPTVIVVSKPKPKKKHRKHKRKSKQEGGNFLSDLGIGVGSAAAGIGQGLGHLFGGAKGKKGRKSVIKM